MAIKIETEGFEELAKNLGNPKLALSAFEETLREAAELGEKTAIEAIEGGTGLAMRSIQYKVWPRTMTAKVYTLIPKPTAASIEKGRKPGETLSQKQVQRWLTGSLRSRNMTRDEFATVSRTQKAITEKGTRGKYYKKAAREAIEKNIKTITRDVLDRVRRLIRF